MMNVKEKIEKNRHPRTKRALTEKLSFQYNLFNVLLQFLYVAQSQ